jgi:hypothetical protein
MSEGRGLAVPIVRTGTGVVVAQFQKLLIELRCQRIATAVLVPGPDPAADRRQESTFLALSDNRVGPG